MTRDEALLNPFAARFAENLKSERSNAGLSQEALAFRCGLHRTQISLLERGDRVPRLENYVRLSDALRIRKDVLLEGIEFQPIEYTGGALVIMKRDRGVTDCDTH